MASFSKVANDDTRRGPLAGLRVVEFEGIGPAPHCAMLFADMGAEVIRITRPGGNGWPNPVIERGRATFEIDLATSEGRSKAAAIVGLADVLIEGFRPGVMEQLELGPEPMLETNPRLVYGRLTGWGRDGPRAKTAGHDITYLAMTGALAAMGSPGEPPTPPLNLVGDFGGGSLYLAFGIMAALWERQRSGTGQVVDAAILDGVASMLAMFTGFSAQGLISLERTENFLGGAAPFYRCYRCADDRYLAVGAIEPRFWSILCQRLEAPDFLTQDRTDWAETIDWLTRTFASQPLAHWVALFEGSDACVAPVLTFCEAQRDTHQHHRGTYVEVDGLMQPAPAPRFSRTPAEIGPTRDVDALLSSWKIT